MWHALAFLETAPGGSCVGISLANLLATQHPKKKQAN